MVRKVKAALLVCGAVAVALFITTRFTAHAEGDDSPFPFSEGRGESDIKIGLRIAPVPLNIEHNAAMVGRGSYLVNAVAGCADCHSCPTYMPSNNPYAGQAGAYDPEHYLAGGVHFGPFVSANITPDQSGRPAGLTRAEFFNVIRTGENHTLFVMPWPIYRNMSDRDLNAIYDYLSAIPHAEPGTACTGAGQ